MQGHTLWEMSRLRAAELLLDAEPARRRPRRRKVRSVLGAGLLRAGYRLRGVRAS